MAEKKEKSFESSLERLDQIVRLLEKGDAPLAESLALFEEGAGLIRVCESFLSDAEQKVVKLRVSGDGSPEETDFR